jgi:hypothetical protein
VGGSLVQGGERVNGESVEESLFDVKILFSTYNMFIVRVQVWATSEGAAEDKAQLFLEEFDFTTKPQEISVERLGKF